MKFMRYNFKRTISYEAAAILMASLFMVSFTFAQHLWTVKDDTKAHFTIDGLFGIDVHGTLDFDSSSIIFEPAYFSQGTMNVSLNVASINTGNKKRDRHLRNEDFFEVEKYPQIKFRSTTITKTDSASYIVSGALTIKEITKTVSIPFSFSDMGPTGIFSGNFKINRLDFGVGTSFKRGIGKEVNIQLQVPVYKK